MPDLSAIQSALRQSKIDAWLFYDILHRDPLAYRILGVEGMAKRRWFYFIPARGTPRKLVHRIEPNMLDALPGQRLFYAGLDELKKNLGRLLGKAKTIAMQYSPNNDIPYVSLVDAGTVEMVRSYRKRIVSSADLVQMFEARWTPAQYESHLEAGRHVDRITQQAFARAADAARNGRSLTEYQLQQWMLDQFRAAGLDLSEPPVVAIGPNSGNPHYSPAPENSAPIEPGKLLLLDVWSKMARPGSVYYDITWTGFLGREIPEKYVKIFNIVKRARDTAVEFVTSSIRAGKTIRGWQVDDVTRNVIRKAGYAKYFVHRTGHSIGQEVHGTGANMDGLETKDDRSIIPFTCFSIEPGIYFPEFGIRTEVDVYVGEKEARVTGPAQQEVLALLA